MNKNVPVSEIMTTDIISVNITNTLFDVKKIFQKQKIRHLPVYSGDKVIGILSKTDFIRTTFGIGDKDVQSEINNALFQTVKITDIMTTDFVTVNTDTLIQDVARILVEN